ncbi:LRR receptor-like serine/threonine-protein kinase ERL1, partial [Mucuna pruriens]
MYIGQALMKIKASFSNVADVLHDWDDLHNDDFCSWRGVLCDNVSLTVISLCVIYLPNLFNCINLYDLLHFRSRLKLCFSGNDRDLQGNKLTGQIPDEIGNCAAIVHLDLSDNQLYGDIPFSISKLKQLVILSLKSNLLTGPIPSTLTQIPNLKTLDLARNRLSGEIPRLLYWNEVLQYLGLRGNMLSGSLSPDICQLTGLWYFDVRGNNLTGSIPDSIGNCTNFEILDLSYNQITGEIPYNIGFLQVATLSLQGNRLTGKIPEVIGLMQALAILDLSENELIGPIPPILGNLSFTGKLYLHGNMITGPIPPELGNMSRLSYLQLNDNQLVGQIPDELGRLEHLFELNLANNHLEGSIPRNVSSCTALNKFNVHGNHLSGSIPLSFSSLESLTYLYISSLFINVIRQFCWISRNLSANNFKGNIPIELGHIINLDTLDLSRNNFSGHVPESVGYLEHLLTLNVSHNSLQGPLPAEFGNLRSIQIIDMSFNYLSSSIPPEIGQLQNLVSLILNNNDLCGKIPDQLTNCLSLNFLCVFLTASQSFSENFFVLCLMSEFFVSCVRNVTYNNLSGAVPLMKNFSRFSADSFIGNPLLCGNWLGSICDPYMPKSRVVFSRAAVVCLIVGVIILLAMVTIAIYRSSQSMQLTKGSSGTGQGKLNIRTAYPEFSLVFSSGPPKLVILHMGLAIHTFDDIMRVTENLNEKYIIGYGASSTVYKCALKNSRPIAIKRLYNQHPHYSREFETELETIGSIRHRNLVTLHGYALTPNGNLLFYDYMENGSLWDLLHGPMKKVKLDWEARLRIAVGAAEGLAYLHHDCNPRIVHRDIKSSNILLDENFEARLSDFGIAKCLSATRTHASTFVLGTIGYIDPEYARTSRLNEKSDVYSFGIVLLELLTGKKAVDNDSNLHHLILSKADNNTIMETVDPEVSITCMDLTHVKKTFQLALLCTKRNPSERPTMHEVARVLASLPAHPSNIFAPHAKTIDYAQFVIQKGNHLHQPQMDRLQPQQKYSNDQWFVRFEDVVSNSSL